VTGGLSNSLAKEIRSRQALLIENAEALMEGESLKSEIKDAFLATPRHAFTPRFQDGRPGLWSEVDESVLRHSLGTIYADAPYCIYRNESGEATSTISQPSLVLFMLQMLDLKPGQRVYELGGGSGWNAALMSRLVGESGQVLSFEIEPALIENAHRALDQLGISNVSLLLGDGSQPPLKTDQFDRGIFTASSWNLPEIFFDLIPDAGLLLFVMKVQPKSDLLLVLRKAGEHFVGERKINCRFVSLTGDGNANQQKGGPKERKFINWANKTHSDLETIQVSVYRADDNPPESEDAFYLPREGNLFVWEEAP